MSPRRLLVASATITVSLAFAAICGPASADEPASPASASQCPAAALCVWGGTFNSGSFGTTKSTTAVASGVSPAKSVWNRSTHAARVYSGAGGTGTSTCFEPGESVTSTSVGSVSFRVLSTTTC
ncbi:peptidase inhibitor family I36 protein [Cellulomonas sp. PhB150]|uniref:peptidase inhibitor family I36 protein n=1 Tax=Cellulomonas sp. PhB150 TaxID=2485188 RepID=UPI000F46A2C5